MADSSSNGTDPERDDATVPQAGVLGNLPRSRPSVRSPRRADPEQTKGQNSDSEDSVPSAPAPPEAEHESSQAELETLARSGLAIAGGAATLGLRIAGRAAAAVRGAVERR